MSECRLKELYKLYTYQREGNTFLYQTLASNLEGVVRNFIAGLLSEALSSAIDVYNLAMDNINDIVFMAISAINPLYWNMYVVQMLLDQYKDSLNREIRNAKTCIAALNIIKRRMAPDQMSPGLQRMYERLMNTLLRILNEIIEVDRQSVNHREINQLMDRFKFSKNVVLEINRIVSFTDRSYASRIADRLIDEISSSPGERIKNPYETEAKAVIMALQGTITNDLPVLGKYADIIDSIGHLNRAHIGSGIGRTLAPYTRMLREIERNSAGYLMGEPNLMLSSDSLRSAIMQLNKDVSVKTMFPSIRLDQAGEEIGDLFGNQFHSKALLQKIMWFSSKMIIDRPLDNEKILEKGHDILENMLRPRSVAIRGELFVPDGDNWARRIDQATLMKRPEIQSIILKDVLKHYALTFEMDLHTDRINAHEFLDTLTHAINDLELEEVALNDKYPSYDLFGIINMSKLSLSGLTIFTLNERLVDSLIDYYKAIIEHRDNAVEIIDGISKFNNEGINEVISLLGQFNATAKIEDIIELWNKTGGSVITAAAYAKQTIQALRDGLDACKHVNDDPEVKKEVTFKIDKIIDDAEQTLEKVKKDMIDNICRSATQFSDLEYPLGVLSLTELLNKRQEREE